MRYRARCSLSILIVGAVLLPACDARAQAVTGAPRSLTLRIQIVSDDGTIARTRIELSSHRPPLLLVQYTDASGQVEFTGLGAGTYTVTAAIAGRQLYRDELLLADNDRIRTETIHVRGPAASGKPKVVSVNELSAPEKAKNLFDTAMDAVRKSRWQVAIEAFNQALVLYPGYAKAHNALGVVLAITKKEQEAEQEFRSAIQFDQTFAEPHYNLGKLLLETKRPIEARRELERNLQLNPRYSPAMELLVESMIVTHDEDAAIALMKSVHQKHVDHAAQLHLEIGQALEQHSRLPAASEQYRFVLRERASERERQQARAGLSRIQGSPIPNR